jgi:ATP-dependent DNA ligase
MGNKRERIANFEVQRPVDFNEKAVQKVIDRVGHVYVDVKYDGIRGLVFFDGRANKWRIVTRENIEIISIADRIAATFANLGVTQQGVYDCEVVVRHVPFDVGSGLLRSFTPLADYHTLMLYIFDIIDIDTRKRSVNHHYPSGWIESAFTLVARAKREVATSLDKVHIINERNRLNGFEGSVVKDPSQEYTPGKVQGWWKLKPKETHDGVITGFVSGTEGKANAGLIVGFEVLLEDGTTCKATGLTQLLMRRVTDMPHYYMGRVVEVERMEASGTGASRHPKFKCFRDMAGAEGIKS